MSRPAATAPLRLGLRANLAQFTLLVAINGLVGAMIGQERTVLPLLADQVFELSAYTAALTFIVAFGLTKALTNLAAVRAGEPRGPARQASAGTASVDCNAMVHVLRIALVAWEGPWWWLAPSVPRGLGAPTRRGRHHHGDPERTTRRASGRRSRSRSA